MGGSNGNKKWDKKVERIARGELDDIVQKNALYDVENTIDGTRGS